MFCIFESIHVDGELQECPEAIVSALIMDTSQGVMAGEKDTVGPLGSTCAGGLPCES